MADLEDDFSKFLIAKAVQEESLAKRSKLTKKKNKNKENVKKPHTSTQNEIPEPITCK